ncbi:MAG TPA: preprotein translocase subunit SecE [Candidatus Paceibacterota bacterium]|nr:preprotein translocase subunit SecE [Candidatus Paceibacterota bacterium]
MKVMEYMRDVRGEMRHVNWPTKSQALNYTLLVIGISVATAIILAIADYAFGLGIEKLILNS